MISDRRKISPKELKSLGWSAGPKHPYACGRSYTHTDGWKISHCGHPTALWPYLLTDPKGRTILTGAAVSGDPTKGTAWPSVAQAVDYVASQQRMKL